MQKVIAVLTSNAIPSGKGVQFIEITYPEIDKALEEGFVIKQVLQATQAQGYTLLTFILEKAN